MKMLPSRTYRRVTLPETGIAGLIVKILGGLMLLDYVALFSVITFMGVTSGFASYQPGIVGKIMNTQLVLAVYSLPFWRTEERKPQAQKPSPS